MGAYVEARPAGERRVRIDDLAAAAHGTAYVESVAVDGGETLVRLAYSGRAVEAVVPTTPGPAAPPAGLGRVFAVLVKVVDGRALCSALGSSADGPRRVDIGVPAALGFAAAGIRTVFTTD